MLLCVCDVTGLADRQQRGCASAGKLVRRVLVKRMPRKWSLTRVVRIFRDDTVHFSCKVMCMGGTSGQPHVLQLLVQVYRARFIPCKGLLDSDILPPPCALAC